MNGVIEAIFDFWSRTEVMALKRHIFAPFLTPQNGRKLPLWEPISLVWKQNLKIASMAPFLRSRATFRYPLRPWYVIDVGCKGGCHRFCCLLSLYFDQSCTYHNSSQIQSHFKFFCCIIIYIFLAFFCHQAQLSSSNRLEMKAKWIRLLKIENGGKFYFLFFSCPVLRF